MKKLLFWMLYLSLIISLIACNPDSTQTQGDLGYSVEEFYDDIVVYETRITNIINAKQQESKSTSSASRSKRGMAEEEWTETITREEILAAHLNGTMDHVYDNYLVQLSLTQLFVTRLRELLEDQKDIAMNEPFHPAGNSLATYRLIHSEEGYALIDAIDGTEHKYLKIGLQDDLLEYQELNYYYQEGSPSPKVDMELLFNYFKFTENKEAIYLRYSPTDSGLDCTSIETDEQFSISYEKGILSGALSEKYGYTLNLYDRETNSTGYLQVVDDQIVRETYDVYDEYDLVFRYEDQDVSDDQLRLCINFVTATGWDYVVASEASSDEIDALTGIYLADGTKIYDDRFNYSFTPTSGFLGMWIDVDHRSKVTDELFSLQQFGLNLDHPKAKVAFLDQVFLDGFIEIKDRFYLENLNFFADDLHQELYQYIDEDIRNDLEGKNDEPIVTTGDIQAFNSAMHNFEMNLEASPHYTSNGTVLTEILSGGKVVSQLTSTSRVSFDLTSHFYKNWVVTEGPQFRDSYAYVLDGTTGKLIECDIYNDSYCHYYILSNVATKTNFLDAYNDLALENDFSNVYEITKISDTEFKLKVAPTFLGKSGIDLNTLFEQQGISGLADQNLFVTYKFTDNYDGFSVSYIIEDLSYGENQVRLSAESTTKIESFTIYSPMDGTSYYYYPASLDQILFTNPYESAYWPLFQGVSYMRLYLEPGEYSIDMHGDGFDPEFKVLNDSYDLLPYDQRFTASYAGYYYLEIQCIETTTALIQYSLNPTPRLYSFSLNSTDGILEMDVDLIPNSSAEISIPSSSEDRFLVFYPKFGDAVPADNYLFGELVIDVATVESYRVFHLSADQGMGPVYLFLPANCDPSVEVQGYFAGTLQFQYQYAVFRGDNAVTHIDWEDLLTAPLVILTEDSPLVRVDFTISETGTYILSTKYMNYGSLINYSVMLYSSDGQKITKDWNWDRDMTAGDYYLEFTSTGDETPLVLFAPRILKR